MNLADAIRQAAASVRPTDSIETPDPTVTSSFETEETPMMQEPNYEKPLAPVTETEPTVVEMPSESRLPEPPSIMVTSGNVVRLELFLGAEQMNQMLRAVMQGQHSVMTLREAASYLRINSGALERMATEGEIPAFSIEGRWRFPKATLDEWLAVRSYHQDEGEVHAA